MPLRVRVATWMVLASSLCTSSAMAHISVSSPGFANQTQVLTFGVGHGCEGLDTSKIEVTIPKEVTSVRALPHVFGPVEVKKDDAGTVTSVIWTNPSPRGADDAYYQLQIRAKLPDSPFSTVLFPTRQTCRGADGKDVVVDWKATPEEVAAAKDGEEPEPAPALLILPVRAPGWNKFTVKSKVTDLSIFNDAQIVWSGDAAFSSNAATAELIKKEQGVTELKEIASGAEIWVKY